jgi:hypothetical protein
VYKRQVHLYYNYSSDPLPLEYPHPRGKELVSGDAVQQGEILEIAPWDVLIIEEN